MRLRDQRDQTEREGLTQAERLTLTGPCGGPEYSFY
jgi:hypothetical protein